MTRGCPKATGAGAPAQTAMSWPHIMNLLSTFTTNVAGHLCSYLAWSSRCAPNCADLVIRLFFQTRPQSDECTEFAILACCDPQTWRNTQLWLNLEVRFRMTILQVEQPATTSGKQLSRHDWACEMRLQFSPAGMFDAQGNIIQSFFKPLGLPIIEERWGPPQQEALLKVWSFLAFPSAWCLYDYPSVAFIRH